jgi:hypothetical protein
MGKNDGSGFQRMEKIDLDLIRIAPNKVGPNKGEMDSVETIGSPIEMAQRANQRIIIKAIQETIEGVNSVIKFLRSPNGKK